MHATARTPSPTWTAVLLVFATSALLSITACRRGVPILDTGPKPVEAHGTISGTVRGPEGTSSLVGRAVEAINVDTGERQRMTTTETGGFTFKVPPGTYRIEISVLEGETVLKQPGVIHVNRSDVDAHAHFVIGSARVSHPRYPAGRPDTALGPPIV